MIPQYETKSAEVEMHSASHVTHEDDEFGNYDECQCQFVSTVQAEYDFIDQYKVRLNTDKFNTFRSTPIWLTANQARELASYLMFAANDADTLNKEAAE